MLPLTCALPAASCCRLRAAARFQLGASRVARSQHACRCSLARTGSRRRRRRRLAGTRLVSCAGFSQDSPASSFELEPGLEQLASETRRDETQEKGERKSEKAVLGRRNWKKEQQLGNWRRARASSESSFLRARSLSSFLQHQARLLFSRTLPLARQATLFMWQRASVNDLARNLLRQRARASRDQTRSGRRRLVASRRAELHASFEWSRARRTRGKLLAPRTIRRRARKQTNKRTFLSHTLTRAPSQLCHGDTSRARSGSAEGSLLAGARGSRTS